MATKRVYRDPDLNLDRLARKATLPARQISAAINRATGKNVSQFVNDFRIAESCSLLVETDSPFLAPVPHRGTRNEPARVVHVVDAIAALRGTTSQTVAEAATGNFTRLFNP